MLEELRKLSQHFLKIKNHCFRELSASNAQGEP